MFYIPNLPYAFYLAAKAKHAAFFSAANPSIKSSDKNKVGKGPALERERPKVANSKGSAKYANP